MAVSLSRKVKKAPGLPSTVTSRPGQGATFQPPPPRASINPPKPPVAPKPPAPVAPKPTSAVTPVPPIGPGFKAPETTTGAGIRTRAQSTYEAALRTGRQGIVDAALRLGSPEIINALKADPNFSEYVAALDKGAGDPTSLNAQSDYNENRGLQGVDQQANAGNTFFSSKRMDDRGALDKQYTDAKSGYLSDYHTNYNNLMGGMGTAFGNYSDQLTDADREDMAQYLATTPQPQAEPATPNPAVSAMPPVQAQAATNFFNNPNWGKDAEWNLSNKPQIVPGKDSHGNPGDWHIYADGHKVFVAKKR